MTKHRNRPRSPKAPIEALHPAEVTALNRAFYATDPADFLRRRLRHLIQIAASSEGEERSQEQTYRYGKLELTTPSIQNEPADENGRERYIAIETEMVLHHAGETLLRLFIAHRNVTAVPWVEITKLRGLGEFKKEIRNIASPPDISTLHSQVATTWTGSSKAPESAADSWREVVTRIAAYLSFLSKLLVDRAGSFNAAKHGLAVQPGDSAIKLQGVPGVEASGPSLAYLGETLNEEKKRFVAVKNRWIDIERDLSLVYVITQLIDGIWNIGRIRYLGWSLPEGGIAVGPAIELGQVLEASQSELQKQTGIHVEEIGFPPAMFSPPGSGADALRPNESATPGESTHGGESTGPASA